MDTNIIVARIFRAAQAHNEHSIKRYGRILNDLQKIDVDVYVRCLTESPGHHFEKRNRREKFNERLLDACTHLQRYLANTPIEEQERDRIEAERFDSPG